jgi:hypothetical protein
MKNLILLSILLLFTNSFVEVHVDRSRFPAAISVDCVELAKSFLGEQKARLAIPPNSLFAKYPVLSQEMEKLEFTPLQLDEFYNDFLKRNRKAPTLRDGMEYIYVLRKEIISSYDEVIAEVKAMQEPALDTFLDELSFSRNKLNKFKDFDLYEDEIENAHNAEKTKLTSLDDPIVMKNNIIETRYSNYLKERSREGIFHGELGELVAFGTSKDKSIKKGLKFETRKLLVPTHYQLVIADAIEKLEADLAKKTNKQLITFVNSYGEGLLRNAHDYLVNLKDAPLDKVVIISKIITMIRTKEIDLIFEKADGRMVWAEVKTYKKPISVETLNGGGYKAKPMIDQLIEHKALRDILGFKDSVDLRFISPTSKITPEAKTMIEGLGYEVIGAK